MRSLVGVLNRGLCFLLLLIYISPVESYGQSETQNISGLVRDRAGIFIANVSVQVQGTDRVLLLMPGVNSTSGHPSLTAWFFLL